MKKEYENMNIVGCDETGVSDYLSPLVAAAVFVPISKIQKLIDMGITDSKQISDNKVKQLAKKILPMTISRIHHFSQKGYNKLNQSLNINELKMFLHLKAINQIEAKIKKIDLIIIDEFATIKNIKRYVKKLLSLNFNLQPIKNQCRTMTKAEIEHTAVAAASIIARAKFLDLMELQNQKWKMQFPLGINNQVEKFACQFVNKYGKVALKEVAKIKFKTTKKIFGSI